MSSIQKINQTTNTYKKPLINPKNTGYAAACALVITTARGFTAKKPISKTHKIFGFITAALTLLHIGCVEYLHCKYKKM